MRRYTVANEDTVVVAAWEDSTESTGRNAAHIIGVLSPPWNHRHHPHPIQRHLSRLFSKITAGLLSGRIMEAAKDVRPRTSLTGREVEKSQQPRLSVVRRLWSASKVQSAQPSFLASHEQTAAVSSRDLLHDSDANGAATVLAIGGHRGRICTLGVRSFQYG